MKAFQKISPTTILWICALVPLTAGCQCYPFAPALYQSPTSLPLGAQSDAMWQRQEANAEASDFVVYQHEFELNGVHLNTGGEDHLRQIAARLHGSVNLPVIVERGMTSVRPDSEFKYPVNPDPELDMRRREVVVRSLMAMGVDDAEQRVVIAPSLAGGMKATEASRAYYQGLNQSSNFGAGYGGFGGSWFSSFGSTPGGGTVVR